MPYYLYRATPIDDWRAYHARDPSEPCAGCMPDEGERIELPGVEWFSQAQAEADRRNGKRDGGQVSLQL